MTPAAPRRRLPIVVGLVLALVVGLLVPLAGQPAPARAAVGSNFDAGFILSDEAFYNRGAMNAGQISAFLRDKGSGCQASTLPCLKDVLIDVDPRPADQFCGALAAASQIGAAQVFEAISIACGINPQVLLVLVEKEQSLVSRTTPTDYSYRYATGFACPDTPPGCSSATAGFVTQVYLAAKQFQRYRVNPGNYNYQAGRNNNILFSPNAACGSSSVFIRNQATAGLYNYTPYQPNAAALANLYGTGDGCSSYGNRNFWRMFTDWFGGTSNLLDSSSFEGSLNGWAYPNGALARQIAGPTSDAKSGQYFVSLYTPTPGRSFAQDVRVSAQQRQSFTGTIWVKSGTVGKTYSGSLVVWGLGGTTEAAVQPFTVGETWTQVTTTLTVANTGHTTIRLEVYLQSTDALLSMDATSLLVEVPEPPRDPVTVTAPSFEGSIGPWRTTVGAATLATRNVGTAAQDGSSVLVAQASNTVSAVGFDVPTTTAVGDTFTATIWARTNTPGKPIEGTAVLSGTGAAVQRVTTSFLAGLTWKQIPVTMTVTKPGITSLRFEVYLRSSNLEFFLDNVSIARNLSANPSFETGVQGWNTGATVLTPTVGVAVLPSPDDASFASTGTTFTGGSIATDTTRRTKVGETYTATIWLRAAAAGNSWDGTLAFWALGGAQELAVTPVSVGTVWTQYRVAIPIAQEGHTTLRVELYTSSPGEVLYLDGLVLN